MRLIIGDVGTREEGELKVGRSERSRLWTAVKDRNGNENGGCSVAADTTSTREEPALIQTKT